MRLARGTVNVLIASALVSTCESYNVTSNCAQIDVAVISKSDVPVGTAQELNARTYMTSGPLNLEENHVAALEIGANFVSGLLVATVQQARREI